jgi:hypothetical protein
VGDSGNKTCSLLILLHQLPTPPATGYPQLFFSGALDDALQDGKDANYSPLNINRLLR